VGETGISEESVYLAGDYKLLLPPFRGLNVRQFVPEYATPRGGGIEGTGKAPAGREIGLGVTNSRTDMVVAASVLRERYGSGSSRSLEAA
jgi:methionine synthase II (cobalamin-independent)